MIRIFKISVLAFVAICSICTGCTGNSSEIVKFQSISFEGRVGEVPAGFKADLTGGGGAVSWALREDPSATTGKALVQESSDDTSYRFPVCIYNDVKARDVYVEVKYKAVSGKVDQAGGIALRYNPENYYVARANALEDNIDLFMFIKGKRIKLREVPAKVVTGQWHTLGFEAKGSRLRVWFDGKIVIDLEDTNLPDSGKIGLWTKADSVTEFADLKVSPSAPQ